MCSPLAGETWKEWRRKREIKNDRGGEKEEEVKERKRERVRERKGEMRQGERNEWRKYKETDLGILSITKTQVDRTVYLYSSVLYFFPGNKKKQMAV